jgi:hypothetical protein
MSIVGSSRRRAEEFTCAFVERDHNGDCWSGERPAGVLRS